MQQKARFLKQKQTELPAAGSTEEEEQGVEEKGETDAFFSQ